MIGVTVLVGALLIALGTVRSAHATTFRWVDEKGVVHYTDKMPADAVNRGHVELNTQGMRVRKTDPALTAEQIRAREEDVERQKQATRDRQESDRRDRALMSSYSREEDIDLARSRALTTIDSQMQSARVYAAALTKRQSELVASKQALGSKPVPEVTERELANIDVELDRTNTIIGAKKQEGLAIASKYDADKQRFRELRAAADKDAAKNAAVGKATISPADVGGPVPNVIPTSATK